MAEIDPMRRDLLGMMEVGKKKAINAKLFSQALELNDEDPTCEKLRLGIIKPMIEEDLIPIGSCSHGFFIIHTAEELAEVVDELDGRISGIQNRKAALIRGFRKHKGKKPKYKE